MKKENRVLTGVQGLDKMLHGGLLLGRTYLLSGPTGSGKSTLAMQFAYNGAVLYNEPSLYVTLEESKEKLIEDMGKQGFDLEKAQKKHKFSLIGGPIAEINSMMYKVDADVNNMIAEIEEVVTQNKIKRVVIDSINLLTMFSKSDDERRRILASLTNTFSALGCTTLLISETEEFTMRLSHYGIEEFVVDGVIALYLLWHGSYFVPGIAVRKMRGSDHDKEVRTYQITNKGILVYPTETLFEEVR